MTNAPAHSDQQRTAFIHAMRGVAARVTVVTTNGKAGQRGATVSAFCSVSADPPTILVCLNKSSGIADAGSDCFSCHRSADVARLEQVEDHDRDVVVFA